MTRIERHGDDAVFRALADETRRSILDELRQGARSTGELAARQPAMSRFGVMDHLAVLVEAGLVVVERRGRDRLNHLNPIPIRRIHDRWLGQFAADVADELIALEANTAHHAGNPSLTRKPSPTPAGGRT
jgi:DNA-binding transcriptional ArsR family regulator